jgi:hypothetical protein
MQARNIEADMSRLQQLNKLCTILQVTGYTSTDVAMFSRTHCCGVSDLSRTLFIEYRMDEYRHSKHLPFNKARHFEV